MYIPFTKPEVFVRFEIYIEVVKRIMFKSTVNIYLRTILIQRYFLLVIPINTLVSNLQVYSILYYGFNQIPELDYL